MIRGMLTLFNVLFGPLVVLHGHLCDYCTPTGGAFLGDWRQRLCVLPRELLCGASWYTIPAGVQALYSAAGTFAAYIPNTG